MASINPDGLREHNNIHLPRLERGGRKRNNRQKALNDELSFQSPLHPIKAATLAYELHAFLSDIETLLDCFKQFPEFVEELPDWSLIDSQIQVRARTSQIYSDSPAYRVFSLSSGLTSWMMTEVLYMVGFSSRATDAML